MSETTKVEEGLLFGGRWKQRECLPCGDVIEAGAWDASGAKVFSYSMGGQHKCVNGAPLG